MLAPVHLYANRCVFGTIVRLVSSHSLVDAVAKPLVLKA